VVAKCVTVLVIGEIVRFVERVHYFCDNASTDKYDRLVDDPVKYLR
jgi:hypothetical protein